MFCNSEDQSHVEFYKKYTGKNYGAYQEEYQNRNNIRRFYLFHINIELFKIII